MERIKTLVAKVLLVPDSFTSPSLHEREKRLKKSKREAESRCQRILSQDRTQISRKEATLSKQLHGLAAVGDYPKALVLARQIAAMRHLSDRNFAAGGAISQHAFCAASNHAILRARVEAIKGLKYANLGESWESVAHRNHKYTERMEEFLTLESMLNEDMDEVYADAEESQTTQQNPQFEQEVDLVLRQLLDGESGKRERFYGGNGIGGALHKSSIPIYLQLFTPIRHHTESIVSTKGNPKKQPSELGPAPKPVSREDLIRMEGVYLQIPHLDINIPTLKKLISEDRYAISHLGLAVQGTVYDSMLGHTRPFRVGRLMRMGGETEFVTYHGDPKASLKELGISRGDVIHVSLVSEEGEEEEEGGQSDEDE